MAEEVWVKAARAGKPSAAAREPVSAGIVEEKEEIIGGSSEVAGGPARPGNLEGLFRGRHGRANEESGQIIVAVEILPSPIPQEAAVDRSGDQVRSRLNRDITDSQLPERQAGHGVNSGEVSLTSPRRACRLIEDLRTDGNLRFGNGPRGSKVPHRARSSRKRQR